MIRSSWKFLFLPRGEHNDFHPYTVGMTVFYPRTRHINLLHHSSKPKQSDRLSLTVVVTKNHVRPMEEQEVGK